MSALFFLPRPCPEWALISAHTVSQSVLHGGFFTDLKMPNRRTRVNPVSAQKAKRGMICRRKLGGGWKCDCVTTSKRPTKVCAVDTHKKRSDFSSQRHDDRGRFIIYRVAIFLFFSFRVSLSQSSFPFFPRTAPAIVTLSSCNSRLVFFYATVMYTPEQKPSAGAVACKEDFNFPFTFPFNSTRFWKDDPPAQYGRKWALRAGRVQWLFGREVKTSCCHYFSGAVSAAMNPPHFREMYLRETVGCIVSSSELYASRCAARSWPLMDRVLS